MNAFFKVKTTDVGEYSGIVFGTDEGDIMKKIVECYEPTDVTFHFGLCYDGDIIELVDLKENPLFDFE